MLSRTMEKILIVGAGITASATAALLKDGLPEKCCMSLWDKSKGVGGRMSTSRSPFDNHCTADLGAQYISATPQDYLNHAKIYNELESCGVLRPMLAVIEGENRHVEGTRHFVPPQGVGSLVKHFLQKAAVAVDCGRNVTDIRVAKDKITVSTDTGLSEKFDCLILTQPVPQILLMKGDLVSLIESEPAVKRRLAAVEYSSRFALALFYPRGTALDLPWAAKYFPDDPVIRFVAVDSAKRGLDAAEVGPSLVVHTTVPFGLAHLEEDKDEVCDTLVLPRLRELLPQLPSPAAVKNHKWRYSQVFKGYEGSPGGLVLNHRPLVVCGGDSFSQSQFDGCLDSAVELSKMVIDANSKL